MAPRGRSKKNQDLRDYPGLHRYADGRYFVHHPVTGKQGSLKTRNKTVAIRRWKLLAEQWEAEAISQITESLADRLTNLATPKSQGDNIHLRDYLTKWRIDLLGHKVDKNGNVSWGPCHVLAMRGPGRGKPISIPSRTDYANDCKQLESRDESAFPLTDQDIHGKLRKLLSPWLQKPTHYNGLRNTLSRVLDHAVAEGLIKANPVRDIKKAIEAKREVLIPDTHYVAITEKLMEHKLNKRIFDGEWRAKICDLIYMMSQQPIDVFGLQEKQVEFYDQPQLVTYANTKTDEAEEFLSHGVITLARHKTKIGIEIEMNDDMASLIRWLQDFKRRQGIISPHLLVYPMYFDKRSRGKPVRHRFMQLSWAEACKEAGFEGQYQLRDLRKKGLTDEFLKQGDNDKGGHDSEAMKKHYRLVKPPKRALNTLTAIRK